MAIGTAAAIGLGAMGVGSAMAGRSARKAADQQAALGNRAIDEANVPRRTQYGSYVGPYSGFMPSALRPTLGGGAIRRNVGTVLTDRGGPIGQNWQPAPAPQMPGGPAPFANPGDKFAYFDPTIREMRERSISNIPTYQNIMSPQLTSTLSGLGRTRGRLENLYDEVDDNAFLNPLLQRIALARGELTRGFTQRGLAGSSLMSNALGDFETQAAPAILQARQAAVDSRRGLLGDIANADIQALSAASAGTSALQNFDNLYANVAAQNLAQEAAALGLTQPEINGLLAAANQIGQAGQLRADATGRTIDTFARLLPMFSGGNTPTQSGTPAGSPFGY